MTGDAPTTSAQTAGRRKLSVLGFLVAVIAYVAVLRGVGALVTAGGRDPAGRLYTSHEVLLGLLVPVLASAVFVYALVAGLGWWRPVLIDHRPVQHWVKVVPAIFVIASLLTIAYQHLANRGVGLTVLLLFSTLCVGAAEEGMFRGIGVTVLRDRGLPEVRVALWSSVIFGLVHLSNAIGTGNKAVAQAVIVSFAGYFFYLARRASGGLLVPALIHGLFDFSVLSATAISPHGYIGAVFAILAYLVTGGVLLIRRHHIQIPAASA